MRVAILHPTRSFNLGDRIILLGVREILRAAFGEYDELVCDLRLAEDSKGYLDSLNWNVDLFVLSGTPWIWDKCHQSRKYEVLQEIFSLLPGHTKKAALGIGSCFPLASNVFEVYLFQRDGEGKWEITRQHTRERLKEIFTEFDYVGTRDRLAFHILKAVGVEVFDSICPAAHIPRPIVGYADASRPLLVFINPFEGVSMESCDKIFLDDFIEFQKWFKETYNPVVVTMDPLDRDWCDGQGWEVKWLKTEDELAKAIFSSTFVVSARVHAAVPAAVWGKKTYIIPWDSRYLTAQRVGVTPILTFSDRDWDCYNFTAENAELKEKIGAILKADKNFVVGKLKDLCKP